MGKIEWMKWLVTAWASIAFVWCGGWSNWANTNINSTIDNNTTLKVIDGPVQNAAIYIVDKNGNEVYIWDTNTTGEIVVKNSFLENIEWNVTLKAEWGSDANGAINWVMYSPVLTVNQLKTYIENKAKLNITPTTTAYNILQKDTNTSLKTNFLQQLPDENNDGKKDIDDVLLHDYNASKLWSLDSALQTNFTQDIRDGVEPTKWEIENVLSGVNTKINKFEFDNNITIWDDFNTSFEVQDTNWIDSIKLNLIDQNWNKYLLKEWWPIWLWIWDILGSILNNDWNTTNDWKWIFGINNITFNTIGTDQDGIDPTSTITDQNNTLTLKPWTTYKLGLEVVWNGEWYENNHKSVEQNLTIEALTLPSITFENVWWITGIDENDTSIDVSIDKSAADVYGKLSADTQSKITKYDVQVPGKSAELWKTPGDTIYFNGRNSENWYIKYYLKNWTTITKTITCHNAN